MNAYSQMEDIEQTRIKEKKLKPHPKSEANCLSHSLFCWELPIIFKGWKDEVTEDDLYTPLKEYKSKELGDELEKCWLKERDFSKNPSLWRSIVKQFGPNFLLLGIFYLPADIAVAILQPFFLRKLLDYYTPDQEKMSIQQAFIYAGGLSVLAFIRIFTLHDFLFNATIFGMKIRVACSSLIYRRSLEMKKESMEKITMGQLVNILSNDVTRFDQLGPYLHYLWIGLVELVVGMYYIDVTLGHTALVGSGIILLCLIFQLFISGQISKNRLNVAEKTDYRIRLMNDIISGMEAVKMYTWEKLFSKLVKTARRLELTHITTASHCRLFNNALKIYIGKLCVFLCVLVCVLTNMPLTSQYVFVLVCIYEFFKISLIVYLPMGVIMLSETVVSIRRIQEVLLHGYQKPSCLAKSLKVPKNVEVYNLKLLDDYKKSPSKVCLENVCIKWDSSCIKNVLDNVTFKASPGELVGVMGPAGSGKSTLLHVILNEVDAFKGKVEREGDFSYAPQEAWIFSASVKQNIIFGEEFNLEKYREVIRVCALERDLTLFPHGDQTLVGERGVMLSGGQRARINLARAVYRDADIYLLDDPLSAVDAHVARHIFDDCIMEYLKKKCVILVTHQIHYLQKADRIYQLECGKVAKVGKYEEVVGLRDVEIDNIATEAAPVVTLEKHELREEVKEHRTSGTKNWKIYKSYCSAAGHWSFTFLVLLLFCLGQLLVSLLDSFLTFWTNVEQKAVSPSKNLADFLTTEHCLYIYIALTVVAVLVIHLSAYVFTLYSMKASRTLHNKMLSKIMYGSMTFFNHNSSGRLLNRFSKDLGCIDEMLPLFMMNLITVMCTAAATIIIIIALNYWMIIPTVIILSITIVFSIMCQPKICNIKKTEGIIRSSVFTHVSATIQGLAIIRAHKAEEKLIQEFDNKQDLHSSSYYLFMATFASFEFWADLLTAAYTVLVIFSFFLLSSGVNIGNVGFAITESINLLGMIQYGVKTWGEVNSQMTSVERVVEYAELNPESDEGIDTPPESWPTEGNISFRSVSLKYSPGDPPVLRETCFEVKSGEKIGIVGRTGAGKTSLISVLFRLFQFEGSIIIDGIDTKSIPLKTLRSKISIIPQEPVLFLGSLRKNIDPLDEFSDSQLWQTLEELEMKPMISNLPSGLETMVSERGSNFSVGQRQLLCLMRAMLRNNKIIVLDEATANVDLGTDELIQSLIRKKFRDGTVLTIAHRLNTVIDSDKILAMDGGKVVEFDHPCQLLLKTDGFFYGFVKKNGDKMMKDYFKIAKKDDESQRVVTFFRSSDS